MSRHLIGQLLGNSKQRHRKPSKGNNSIHFHVRTRRNLKQMKYFTIHVSDLEIRAWLHFRYISLKFLQTSHMLVHVRHAIFIFKKYIKIIFIIKAMINKTLKNTIALHLKSSGLPLIKWKRKTMHWTKQHVLNPDYEILPVQIGLHWTLQKRWRLVIFFLLKIRHSGLLWS